MEARITPEPDASECKAILAALAAEVERLVIEEIDDMSDDELLRANAALSPSSRGES